METGLFSFDIIRDVLLENYDNVMKSYGDEAIDDAMKTIKDSCDMYNLYKNGRYKPLSFWSIQKLLKNAIALNRGIVRLAYFSDTPKPIAGPSNCEKCNDKFIKMFDEYRETLDPKVLFEEIQCECKKYIIR